MAKSHLSAILCADWAKEQTKRSVYIAHVQTSRVRRVDGDWTLDTVLEEAAIWSKDGRVLTTFDLPLGVPKSYLAVAAQIPSWIGTALLAIEPCQRHPLIVAKSDASVRRAAISCLKALEWVRRHDVTFEDLDAAEASEDDFDACVSAAAILRCLLDGVALHPADVDSVAEGAYSAQVQ